MSELPENLRNILHEKENICNALNQLANASDIDYQTEISKLSDAYSNAGGLPPEYAELMDKKFAEAVKNAQAGENAYKERQEKIARLAGDTDALLAAGELATYKEVETLEKTILELAPASGLAEKLAPLKAQLAAEEEAVRAAEETVSKLADELEALCALEDITPLHDRKPGIEAEFAQLANIPRKAAAKYQDAHRKASVKLAQHYETLDLARWESYTRKLDICNALKKMLDLPDEELNNAGKKLTELREQWKNLGSVPKEKNEEINPKYLDLTRKLQHKIDEFFARKRQMQKIAAAEKELLCAETEALADSTDWKNTAEKFRELQAKWKNIPRAGSRENELYQRFRAGQDKFFNARKAAFDERDKRFQQSCEIKSALITEAENLTDPRRARQLREEFRNAGFAGKQDQELYQKFNAAMDNFFNARKAENASREGRAKELISEINTLAADPAASIARVREIREELRTLNCRETKNAELQSLRKFDQAFNEAKMLEQRRREENSDSVAMSLAMAYEEWKNGGSPALPAMEAFAGFSKLQSAAKLLADAISGDEKAAARLEKQIAIARSERENICTELEKLCGNTPAENDVIDLAAELQSAMLGDFGKSSSTSSKAADPQKLCADFAASGIVPPAELTKLQERFAAAKAIIFQEK